MAVVRPLLAVALLLVVRDAASAPSLALTPGRDDGLASASNTESNARQAEASIEQVQADLKRMSTFGEEVERTLREQEKTKQ